MLTNERWDFESLRNAFATDLGKRQLALGIVGLSIAETVPNPSQLWKTDCQWGVTERPSNAGRLPGRGWTPGLGRGVRTQVRYSSAHPSPSPSRPMIASLLSISAGASLGAILRWLLASVLNPIFPALPLGTLAANLVGGYLVGIAVALFAALPDVSPQVRLFVITGFLGGLTTFSTFSAEVVTQLQQGHGAWALATALTHMIGSFVLCALGIATVGMLRAG